MVSRGPLRLSTGLNTLITERLGDGCDNELVDWRRTEIPRSAHRTLHWRRVKPIRMAPSTWHEFTIRFR